MRHSVSRIAITAGVVTAALACGGYALASSSGPAATSRPTFECIKIGKPATHYIEHGRSVPRACDSGYVLVGIGARGAKGPRGATGLRGATGPTGPAGPPGPATSSVTAITVITGRDDSGNGTGICTASSNTDCWATDSLSRVMTVTRNGAVPADNCGSQAVQCWLYTASLADTGTFRTVSGAETPNQECSEPNGGVSCAGLKISGTVSGAVTGGGQMEFYADQAPSALNVPGTETGDAPTDTSDWYKLFFPADTNFGLTSASQAPWTTWSWTYSAPSTCETWTDAENNGDGNGSYDSDGNIAGINQCSG